MRISLEGDTQSCAELQSLLSHKKIGGIAISDNLPSLRIGFRLHMDKLITLDSAQGELERHALELISELTRETCPHVPVALMRHCGKSTSEHEILVYFPEEARRCVEVGVFRAILRTINHGGKLWWLKRSLFH